MYTSRSTVFGISWTSGGYHSPVCGFRGRHTLVEVRPRACSDIVRFSCTAGGSARAGRLSSCRVLNLRRNDCSNLSRLEMLAREGRAWLVRHLLEGA